MATATANKEENSRKIPDQQEKQPISDPPSTEIDSLTRQQSPPPAAGTDSSRKDSDESKGVGVSPEAVTPADPTSPKNDANAPVSDVQKKIRRAERFGMPVQMSEEEKRNSRAERFGQTNAMHGSDELKKSEEQKRKARAERFGLVQGVPADEELKKKARLDRFAAVPKTDSQEEEKKKARALRFSKPPSGSLSQVNGKGNEIEVKTATTAKASGEA
ncbi:hypothetical protein U1Q18_008390 [Sarracenia purpurea var. burkii]